MLQVFIAIIVISFMALFVVMSLPMMREHNGQGDKAKSKHHD